MASLGRYFGRWILGQREPSRLEIAVALALWGRLFLLIVTLAMGRSIGTALFLNRFDSRGLAFNYILVGLTVAGLAGILDRVAKRRDAGRVSLVTLIGMLGFFLVAGNAFLYWAPEDYPIACALFYLAIEAFAFLTNVQFWAITNSVLSLEQATRLYVFVGTGGIVGSVVGGAITRWLANQKALLAESIFLIAAIAPLQILFLLVFDVLSERLRSRQPKHRDAWNFSASTDGDGLDDPQIVARTSAPTYRRLVNAMGAVSLLMVFSTTLIDFYYKRAAERQFAGDLHHLTGFFGDFYLSVGAVTLFAQTVFTPWILRRGSAFAGLYANPALLVLFAGVNLLQPTLLAATLLKLGDSVMSHSVYRSCQEMLYTPLPTGWSARLKARADGVYGRYGLFLAGIFLTIYTSRFEGQYPSALLPFTIVASLGWLVCLARVQRLFQQVANETTPAATDQPIGALGENSGSFPVLLPFPKRFPNDARTVERKAAL